MREIGRICAEFAKCVGNRRGCKSIVFANFAQICAKFTAPFVTIPSVLVRGQGRGDRKSVPQESESSAAGDPQGAPEGEVHLDLRPGPQRAALLGTAQEGVR